ncbi:hypothetical protein ACLOJK_030037 [Asimina triloba]
MVTLERLFVVRNFAFRNALYECSDILIDKAGRQNQTFQKIKDRWLQPFEMLSEMGTSRMLGSDDGTFSEDLGKELELLLQEQRRQEASDREELNLYRSGSAPPTVEGSLAAVGSLFGHGSGDVVADLPVSKSRNGFLSEEELRSDPAYLSYYYAHVKLNPRLPPPVLSKEDMRLAHRLQAGGSAFGGIGDRRNVNRDEDGGSKSLFSLQTRFNSQQEELQIESRKLQRSSEWLEKGGDGLIGLSGLGLGGRQKSLAEIFQNDLGRTQSVSGLPSRPASCNAFDNDLESLGSAEAQLAQLHQEMASVAPVQSIGGIQSISGSNSFASPLGASLSRSATPDPQLLARAPSPRLPPVGERYSTSDKKVSNGSSSFNASSSIRESADLVAALSGISLSANGGIDEENNLQPQIDEENDDHHNFLFDLQGAPSPKTLHQYLKKPGSSSSHLPSVPKPLYSEVGKDGAFMDQNHSFIGEGKADLRKPSISSTNLYGKVPMPVVTGSGGSPHYQSVDNANMGFTSYGSGGYSMNQALPSVVANHLGTLNLPPLFGSAAAASAVGSPCMDGRAIGGGLPAGLNLSGAAELQKLNRMGNHSAAAALQVPLMDPSHVQYLRTAEYAAQLAGLNDPSLERNYQGSSYAELLGLQKAYLGALLSPQKSQFGVPYLNKTGSLNHGYYGNPAFGLGMPYPGSPLSGPAIPASPLPGSSIRNNERSTRFPSGMRNLAGGVMGSWHPDIGGNLDEGFVSSLLEEFKSNKTRCFELSEIAGHVVEFSADQYGSRFIQQKLETATTEEKNMVFEEISPQALSLMTDVFGNYVIQKFFEHGSSTQRRELANQLTGHEMFTNASVEA